MSQNGLFEPKILPSVHIPSLIHELTTAGVSLGDLSNPIHALHGDIVTDSRKISSGCIFIAIKGQSHDGHEFISLAAEKQAGLVICEVVDTKIKVPQLLVRNSREAWSWACSLAYSHPGNELKLIGVTGTNGKTSTVWMIRCVLEALGIKTATIGTLGFYAGDQHFESNHTTPDPPILYAMLRSAKDAGCSVAAMEVSSHALEQKKLSPLRFTAAGMTRLSRVDGRLSCGKDDVIQKSNVAKCSDFFA